MPSGASTLLQQNAELSFLIVVRGKGRDVRTVADSLISTKGVKHGKLTMTTTGKELA
jgi:metal-responsive CopG/Arc/MetJ family transcriptional regulator